MTVTVDTLSVITFYEYLNCKIPFLNGDLFEPIECCNWQYSKFEIPNCVFSNIEEKGERNADGILYNIFDRYNFTMNEDEQLERVVALDLPIGSGEFPLGMVYEFYDLMEDEIKIVEGSVK